MTQPLPRHPAPSPADSAYSLQVGAVVGGKYRLEKLLGSGGMGEVYLAFHEQLGQRVAIKVLQEKALLEPGLRGRFQREAMAAARLANDHIARVFDIGELPSGTPFMVMEYLEGQDLSDYLDQRVTLPVPEVLDLLWQLCSGIAVAHAAGIVHRDLKPANLFLLPRPQGGFLLKILDFGIAKAPEMQGSVQTQQGAARGSAAPTQLTQTASLLGSARYMAPEQMESARDVDARADLWSLGVIGYRMLTGKNPFEGESFEELFLAISLGRRVPLGQARPDLAPPLVAAIEGCLQPVRDHRWASVAALQSALRAAFPPPAALPGQIIGAPRYSTAAVVIAGLTALLAIAISFVPPLITYLTDGLTIDLTHAEPLDLLVNARYRAEDIAPSAVLSMIAVRNAHKGAVELDEDGVVAFTYATPRAASRSLVLSARKGRMFSQKSNNTQLPVTDPRCRYGQAWKAAVGAGLPANAEHEAIYGWNGRATWSFEVKGAKVAEVDGQTCAVIRGR